jgi:hypothetical protein
VGGATLETGVVPGPVALERCTGDEDVSVERDRVAERAVVDGMRRRDLGLKRPRATAVHEHVDGTRAETRGRDQRRARQVDAEADGLVLLVARQRGLEHLRRGRRREAQATGQDQPPARDIGAPRRGRPAAREG